MRGVVATLHGGARQLVPRPEIAFYRKYSEGMLRRYVRLAMSAGRVSGLLGREVFTGTVSPYKLASFEETAIFCLDVERCWEALSDEDKVLLRRVAVQDYTIAETACLLGLTTNKTRARYGAALDRMTAVLLERGVLLPALKHRRLLGLEEAVFV